LASFNGFAEILDDTPNLQQAAGGGGKNTIGRSRQHHRDCD
jgi:hypothetical protein